MLPILFVAESGREDSNLRPSAPKADALAGLRYAPKFPIYKLANNKNAVSNDACNICLKSHLHFSSVSFKLYIILSRLSNYNEKFLSFANLFSLDRCFSLRHGVLSGKFKQACSVFRCQSQNESNSEKLNRYIAQNNQIKIFFLKLV